MHSGAFVPWVAWTLPFAALLLSIAVFPLAAPRLWESNLRKLAVAGLLAAPVLVLYARARPEALLHAAEAYVSFIVLLGGLFVISGGILLEGDLEATPRTNAAFLGLGALLASFVGTTGASMLLIRPLLQTNRERKHVAHTVVFFIFLVSNIGGCLTPLGDPPLFLGYLMGVPFVWTFRLLVPWLVTTSLVLGVYFLWDRRAHALESRADLRRDFYEVRPLRLAGKANFLLLFGVLVAVAFLREPWREVAIVSLAAVSLVRTDPGLRRANHFTFHPILEVAALFAGIFATMLPALDLLRARGAELGVREPWQFFWASGALSSFLDNAPTYLTFVALGQGLGLRPDVAGVPEKILAAISLGSVFMGANTYIGNGPNFMVRSIAEERGVRMPSFGGYMLYSGLVLVPVFVVVTLVFFRP
ncbi:MAG TPA: sodium:proton antiporter [Vicinamibacteria bacterium]|nr:sodium:proton antiporter [Vicinamibacteria bacterium]